MFTQKVEKIQIKIYLVQNSKERFQLTDISGKIL